MEIEEGLKNIGLSETETRIYLSLLKTGANTVVNVSKETQLHRRTIYDNLNLLLKKGLVSKRILEGIKLFQANPPSTLKLFLKEKEFVLDSILPSIISYYNEKNIKPEINIHIGIQGAKSLIEKAILSKKELFWMGGGASLFNRLGFSRKFFEKKLKDLKIKTIQPKIKETENISFIEKNNVRYLPKEFISETGYLIFGDTVIISIIQKDEITSIEIKNENNSKAFLNYFDLIWKIAKP